MKKVICIVLAIIALSSVVPAALAVGEIGATSAAQYSDPEGIWSIPYTSIAPLGFEPTKSFKKTWSVWDSTDPYAWERVNLQLNKLGQSKAATSLRPLSILAVYTVAEDGTRTRVDKTQVQALLDQLTEMVVRQFKSPASFKLNGKKTTGTRTLYACNIETLTSKHTLRYVLVLPDGQELGIYSRAWNKKDKIEPIDGCVWVLTLKKAKKTTPSTPSKPSQPSSPTYVAPPTDPGRDPEPSKPTAPPTDPGRDPSTGGTKPQSDRPASPLEERRTQQAVPTDPGRDSEWAVPTDPGRD